MRNGKFDCVLMNPPYNGSLHLRFLEKAIRVSKKIVNISPSGFFTNIGTYSTYEIISNEIISHLYDYELIDKDKSNYLFGTGTDGIKSDLHIGLYINDYNDGKPLFDELLYGIYKKLRYKTKLHLRSMFIRKNDMSEYGVKIYRYHHNKNTPYYDDIICIDGKAVEGIDFKNIIEKNNFIKSIKSWVYQFIYLCGDVNPAHLPWLGDYTHEWTDEDLYKFFNISDEETKIIENFIKDKYWKCK